MLLEDTKLLCQRQRTSHLHVFLLSPYRSDSQEPIRMIITQKKLFIVLFVWKLVKYREDTHRNLLSAGSLQIWLQCLGLVQAKARCFFQIFLMGSRSPTIWAIFYCFPQAISKEAEPVRSEQLGHEPCGKTALQVAVLPAMPQCWLKESSYL